MRLIPKVPTLLKSRPLQSSELKQSDLKSISTEIAILKFNPPERSQHFRVYLSESEAWWVYRPHVSIFDGDTELLKAKAPLPPKIHLNVPYFSQRDNELHPTGSCNVTSMAMCLSYLGIQQKTDANQFEDELFQYCEDNGLSRHSPQDLKIVVEDYGAKDNFQVNAKPEEVKEWLADGKPCVVHGYFTTSGHIIAIVGYDEKEKAWIANDPWGEWNDWGYSDSSGAGLYYSYDLINRVCCPDGDFWVHFLSK